MNNNRPSLVGVMRVYYPSINPVEIQEMEYRVVAQFHYTILEGIVGTLNDFSMSLLRSFIVVDRTSICCGLRCIEAWATGDLFRSYRTAIFVSDYHQLSIPSTPVPVFETFTIVKSSIATGWPIYTQAFRPWNLYSDTRFNEPNWSRFDSGNYT